MVNFVFRASLLCLLFVQPLTADDAPQRPNRPNVLFIFSDDQQADAVHALGNDAVQTPRLDRLYQRGFAFHNNYVQGSMSGAVCFPSRAMLNSGRTLWHADLHLETGPLWGAEFRRAGYDTFGTGKWHNGKESFVKAFSHGKAAFFGGMCDHDHVPVQDLTASGELGEMYFGKKFSSELFADAAVEFIRNREDDRPFFAYVAFTAPHDPRTPPGEYAAMYDPNEIPLPKNFMPEHPFDNGELRIRDEVLAPQPRTPEIVRRHIADYYGMISHMDAQIGRILDALEESGHAKNTIIIFSSDNGLALGRHGLLGKQNLYQHSDRMPLVFAGPNIPHGDSDALAYLLDLFPTVCELTGVDIPEEVEGKSLAPIIRGKSSKVRDHCFGAYRTFQRMIRDSRWKLIEYNVKGKRTVQLFDLENDPLELENLADLPSAAGELQRLESLLKKTQVELDDPAVKK